MIDIITRDPGFWIFFIILDVIWFIYTIKTLKFLNHEQYANKTVIIIDRFILLLDIFYPALLFLITYIQGYSNLYYNIVLVTIIFWWILNLIIEPELFRRYIRSQYKVSLKESIGLTYTYKRLHIREIIQERSRKASPLRKG